MRFPQVERTERRTAYEGMMDSLSEEGSVFQVDLPIKRNSAEGQVTWYCRVFAQRQTDPVTGEPIIMVSHQDVTNLRKVEGELGRMQMTERTNKELTESHDIDVAGSLLTLLGENGWANAENMGHILRSSGVRKPVPEILGSSELDRAMIDGI